MPQLLVMSGREVVALDLVWSMIGLEALYEKGNADITSQLVEKTQALFGPQADFKKDVRRMYDYRSRLVHGDLDFPGHFFEYLDEGFSEESGRYAAIASAILVATLQEMCLRGIYSLEFKYSLSEPTQ